MNPYLTFAISAFVELLGVITSGVIVERLGRKKSYGMLLWGDFFEWDIQSIYLDFLGPCLFIAGLACLSIVFLGKNEVFKCWSFLIN